MLQPCCAYHRAIKKRKKKSLWRQKEEEKEDKRDKLTKSPGPPHNTQRCTTKSSLLPPTEAIHSAADSHIHAKNLIIWRHLRRASAADAFVLLEKLSLPSIFSGLTAAVWHVNRLWLSCVVREMFIFDQRNNECRSLWAPSKRFILMMAHVTKKQDEDQKEHRNMKQNVDVVKHSGIRKDDSLTRKTSSSVGFLNAPSGPASSTTWMTCGRSSRTCLKETKLALLSYRDWSRSFGKVMLFRAQEDLRRTPTLEERVRNPDGHWAQKWRWQALRRRSCARAGRSKCCLVEQHEVARGARWSRTISCHCYRRLRRSRRRHRWEAGKDLSLYLPWSTSNSNARARKKTNPTRLEIQALILCSIRGRRLLYAHFDLISHLFQKICSYNRQLQLDTEMSSYESCLKQKQCLDRVQSSFASQWLTSSKAYQAEPCRTLP